jgi:plastocyanin
MEQVLVTRKRLACISLGLVASLWAGALMAQQVDIEDFSFNPQVIEIEAGQTVTWVNQGSTVHTSTSDDALWDSGSLSPDQQFSHTFNDPGTFPYYCQPHGSPGGGGMSGTVVVTGVVVTHLVSTNVTGPGSISPTSADVEEGETAEFTLTADFGASIESVSGCGGSLVGSIYTTGPITEDCTVAASFNLDTYTVSTSVTGPGSIDPGSAIVEHGQTTEFTLTPDENASLDEVGGCDGSLDDNIYTTGPIVGPCTVSASFSLDSHTVSTNVTGPGSIDPDSAELEHGATATFTLQPEPDAVIDSVSGCDGSLENKSYTTGPITGPCIVNAVFIIEGDPIYQDRFELEAEAP